MFNDLTSGSPRDRKQTSWVLSSRATCWFREARANPKLMQAGNDKMINQRTLNKTCHKDNNAESNSLASEVAANMKELNRSHRASFLHQLTTTQTTCDFMRIMSQTACRGTRERLEQSRDTTNNQNYSPSPMKTHVRNSNKTTNTKTTTASVSRVRFRSEAPKWFERAAWLTASVIALLLVASSAAAVAGQEVSRNEAEQQVVANEQVAGTNAEPTTGASVANEDLTQQKVPLDDAQLNSDTNPQEANSRGVADSVDQASSGNRQVESVGIKAATSDKKPEAISGDDREAAAAISASEQQQQQQQQQTTLNDSEQTDQQPQVHTQSDEGISAPVTPQGVQDSEQNDKSENQQQVQQQQSHPNEEEEGQARVADRGNEPPQRTATSLDNDLPPVASQFAGSGQSRFGAKHTPVKQVEQSERAINPKTGSRQLKRAQGGHANVFGRKRTSQADGSQSAPKTNGGNRRPNQQQHHHHHYYYQTVNQNQNQNQAGDRQARAQTSLKHADFPDYKEILVQPENVGANEYEAQRRPVEFQQSSVAASEQQNQQQQQLEQTTTTISGGSSHDQSGFEFSQQQQLEQQSGKDAPISEQVAATTTSPGPYIRLSNIATINSSTTSGTNSSLSGGQPSEMKLMRIYVIDLDQKLVVGPNAYSNNEANGEQKPANGTGGQINQSASPMDSSESARIEQTKVEVGGPNSEDQVPAQNPYNEHLVQMLQMQQSSNVFTTTTSMAPRSGPEPTAVVEQYHNQQHQPKQQQQQPSIDANTVRLNPAEFVLVDRDSLQANLSQLVAAIGQPNGGAQSLSTGYHYRHNLQQAGGGGGGGDNHRPSGSLHQVANYEPSQVNSHLANNGTTSTTTTTTTYNTNSGNQYLGPFKKQDHDEQSQAQLNLGPGNSARATTSSSNQLVAADNGNQSLSVAHPQLMQAHGQFAAVYPAPKQHHHHHHHQLQQQQQIQLQHPVPQYTAPQYNSGSNGSATQSELYDRQQVFVGNGQYSTSTAVVADHQLGQYGETSANYTAQVHSPALNPAEPSTEKEQQQPQLDKYQAPARGANMSANLYAAQPPDYSMYQQQQQQQQQHPISSLTQVYDAHGEPGQRQHNEPIQKSPVELGPYRQAAAKVTTEAKLLALHQSDHWKPVDFASPVVVGSVSSVGAPPQAQTQVNFHAQKSVSARLNGQAADHDIVSLNSRQNIHMATNPSDRPKQQQHHHHHQNGSAASDGHHASSGATLANYVNIEQQQQYHLRPSGEFAPSQQVHAHPSSSLSLASGEYSKQAASNGTAAAGLTLTGVTNEYGGAGGRYSRANASQIQTDPNQSDEAPKIPRVQPHVSAGSYRRPGGESSSPYAFQEASSSTSGEPDSDSESQPSGYTSEVSNYGHDYANKFNNSSKQLKIRPQRPKGRPKKPALGSIEAAAQFATQDSSLEQSGGSAGANSYQTHQQLGADLSGGELNRQPVRNQQYLQDGSGGPYSMQLSRPNAAHGPGSMRPSLNGLQPYAASQFRPGFGVSAAAKGLLSWQTISSVASGAAKRIPGALSSILSPFGMGSAMRQQSNANIYPTAQSSGYPAHLVPNLPSNFAKQIGSNAHLASIYQQPPYPFRHMNPPESYSDSATFGHHVESQDLAEGGGEVQDNGNETTIGEETGHESDASQQDQHESTDQAEELGSGTGTGATVTVSVGPVEQEIGGERTTNSSTKSEVLITDLAEISADGKPLKTTKPRGGKTKTAAKGPRGSKPAGKPLKLAHGAELEAAQAAVLSSIEKELEQQDQVQKQNKRKPGKKMRQAGRPNVSANFGMAAGNNVMSYQTNELLAQIGAGGGNVAPQLSALRGGSAPTLTGLQIGQYKIVPQTQFVQSIIEPSRQMLGQYFKQYIGQLGQLG